jgi:3-dehydroquinate synthase
MWDKTDAERQDALIKKAGLPTQLPAGLDIEAVIDTLQTDKKVKDGKVRFILPTRIGEVIVTDKVEGDLMREVLPKMQAV